MQRTTRLSGRLAQYLSSAKSCAESGDIDEALAVYENLIKEVRVPKHEKSRNATVSEIIS